MLLCQHGCGHQHSDLLVVHHGLEGSAQRDLRLAVARIAADQPVHRARLLHILLDCANGIDLIVGLHVGEASLQFLLPLSVDREGVSAHDLA